MKKFLIILFLLISDHIRSQGFSMIYDYILNGQCKHYLVFPKKDNIYVLGDYIDSAGITTKPFWAKFNYKGERLSYKPIMDTNFNSELSFDPFMPYSMLGDSVIYISTLRFINNNPNGSSNIIALNIFTGELETSLFLPYETYGLITSLYLDSNQDKLIAGTASYNNKNKIEVIILDKNLNLLNRLKYSVDSQTTIIPYYINSTNKGYKIIGEENKINNITNTIGFFQLNLSDQGLPLSYKKAKTSIPLSGWFLANQRIFERKDGDIIISSNYYVNDINAPNDENLFAHPIRINSTFDSIRWELKMYNKPNYSNPYQLYSGLISLNNETEYIGYGFDLFNQSGSCVLYKFNENGDSLWYKRIIPGDGKRDSTGWVPTYMAAESPRGGFVVVGGYHDERRPRYSAIRSFIMYLDNDGCLVPDCNKIVTNKDIEDGNEAYFKIYPNPVVDQLKVLCNYSQQGSYNFSLINMQGIEVWNKNVSCNRGDQIFWSMEDVVSGTYIIQVRNKNGKIIQSESIIKI